MDKIPFTGQLNFIGELADELPSSANYNDICIYKGGTYIYTEKWIRIDTKPKEIEIKEAAEIFNYWYEKAELDMSIRKPISWALYRTWRYFHKREESRNEKLS